MTKHQLAIEILCDVADDYNNDLLAYEKELADCHPKDDVKLKSIKIGLKSTQKCIDDIELAISDLEEAI